MVLRMCDVCRKIQKPSSVMSVQLTIPSDEIAYQKKNGDYGSIPSEHLLQKDMCYNCSIKLLGQFFPDYRFLTENELNELKKDR